MTDGGYTGGNLGGTSTINQIIGSSSHKSVGSLAKQQIMVSSSSKPAEEPRINEQIPQQAKLTKQYDKSYLNPQMPTGVMPQGLRNLRKMSTEEEKLKTSSQQSEKNENYLKRKHNNRGTNVMRSMGADQTRALATDEKFNREAPIQRDGGQDQDDDQFSLSNLPINFPTTLKNKHVEKLKKEDLMSSISSISGDSVQSLRSDGSIAPKREGPKMRKDPNSSKGRVADKGETNEPIRKVNGRRQR